jgi:hypothetical protein
MTWTSREEVTNEVSKCMFSQAERQKVGQKVLQKVLQKFKVLQKALGRIFVMVQLCHSNDFGSL